MLSPACFANGDASPATSKTMLRPDELLSSPVVANATMNRGRGLSGVNSYERDLRFSITEFLMERVREHGEAVWYDACCGEGRALAEAAPNVHLQAADVAAWALERPADLITCVHGLHYLGYKLGFLQNAYTLLTPGGLLLGHLDASNVLAAESGLPFWRQAARHAAKNGAVLELKSHVLRVQRTDAPLNFGVTYQGATISEKPNYTGITVVDSWYAMA